MLELKILIADDQLHYRAVLESKLRELSEGYCVPEFIEASTAKSAVEMAEQSQIDGNPFDLILMDINFEKVEKNSTYDGHWASTEIRESLPNTLILMVSGLSDQEHQIQAEQNSAVTRFLRKGHFLDEELFRALTWACLRKIHAANTVIPPDKSILGQSGSIVEYLERLDQVDENTNLLIFGETGTGKELSALRVHENAKFTTRDDARPFASIDCGVESGSLLSSKVFGHTKGAFTGAVSNQSGLLATANGGDLFLDELQSASLEFQKALMRAVESGEYTPVGGTVPQKFNLRIICAINKKLEILISEGILMPDFVARVAKSKIQIPPLRSRKDDIPFLIESFRARIKKDKTFSLEALDVLTSHAWPENVRGLSSFVAFAMKNSKTPMISSDSVGTLLKDYQMMPSGSSSTSEREIVRSEGSEDLIKRALQEMTTQGLSLEDCLEQMERVYYQEAIKRHKCAHATSLAKALELPLRSIRRRSNQLGLEYDLSS